MASRTHIAVATVVSMAALVATIDGAGAEQMFAISNTGSNVDLLGFDTATPGAVTTIGPITGLVPGQVLRAIDFRASNGVLYAMSTQNTSATLYTIDLTTAAATVVGGTITLTGLASFRVSMDFNPVADVLRVVTGDGNSYRINADTGALIAQDTDIVDIASVAPLISGIAYSNNVTGAASTTLYAYDFTADDLGTIGGINGVPSPNTGTFNRIGNSGIVSFNAALGFDISGATGIGYVSVDEFASGGFNAELFTIDLATGVMTQISPTDFASILDISVRPAAPGAVPAPASLALLATGVGLAALRRRTTPARG